MEELIGQLKESGVLKSPEIESALRHADRGDFVLAELKGRAYADEALPLGFEQTISQPYTVVFMLELLNVQKGQRVMEAGYGSGWQSALLARLAGEDGEVFSYEIVPELCEFGRKNLLKYSELAKRVRFFCESAEGGVADPGEGGLDRIIASAALAKVPEAWRSQLKEGGIMVYPSGRSIFREIKVSAGKFSVEEYPGFLFVPFLRP